MPLELLSAYWLVCMLLVISPGADWAYIIGSSTHKTTLTYAIIGLLFGYLVTAILIASGIGAFMMTLPELISYIGIAGALYLIFLGVKSIKGANDKLNVAQADRSYTSSLVKGFVISGLNPKAFLLYLSLLPQFIVVDAMFPVWLQMLIMGLILVLNCALVYTLLGFGVSKLILANQKYSKYLRLFSGVAMITIGGVMFVA